MYASISAVRRGIVMYTTTNRQKRKEPSLLRGGLAPRRPRELPTFRNTETISVLSFLSTAWLIETVCGIVLVRHCVDVPHIFGWCTPILHPVSSPLTPSSPLCTTLRAWLAAVSFLCPVLTTFHPPLHSVESSTEFAGIFWGTTARISRIAVSSHRDSFVDLLLYRRDRPSFVSSFHRGIREHRELTLNIAQLLTDFNRKFCFAGFAKLYASQWRIRAESKLMENCRYFKLP